MNFKTPKGIELPFLDLKGKKYLQVAHRLIWFREQYPDWSIQTSILNGLARAEIRDNKGVLLATAHKSIPEKQFGPELAETGAVGRALAYLGLGTAHALELREDESDIADAPLDSKKTVSGAPSESLSPGKTFKFTSPMPTGNTTGYDERHEKKMNEPATEKQITMITGLALTDLGWDRATASEWLHNKVGKISTKDLTKAQASTCIETLMELRDRAVKDFAPGDFDKDIRSLS